MQREKSREFPSQNPLPSAPQKPKYLQEKPNYWCVCNNPCDDLHSVGAWSWLFIIGRIIFDVAAYRLQKREMANLASSLTLCWALSPSPTELFTRAIFGIVLNLFVYLVNDCFDIDLDLAAPGRDKDRTRFLAMHRIEAWQAVGLLCVFLVLYGAFLGSGLLLTALINIVVIFAYSAFLKQRPIFDVLSMGLWGVSMAMVGFAPSNHQGWKLAFLLGFLSMVTECVQVLRDEPSDRRAGVQTTAVYLGVGATSILARTILVCAALYAALQVHPVGLLLGLGILVPLSPAQASRSWDLLRVLFGLVWLVLVLVVRWGG